MSANSVSRRSRRQQNCSFVSVKTAPPPLDFSWKAWPWVGNQQTLFLKSKTKLCLESLYFVFQVKPRSKTRFKNELDSKQGFPNNPSVFCGYLVSAGRILINLISDLIPTCLPSHLETVAMNDLIRLTFEKGV